jgi:hypothetical protein
LPWYILTLHNIKIILNKKRYFRFVGAFHFDNSFRKKSARQLYFIYVDLNVALACKMDFKPL